VKTLLTLARQLDAPTDALARFISARMTTKSRGLVHKAVAAEADSLDVRHALQDELNRLLPRRDLKSRDHFTAVTLPDSLKGSPRNPSEAAKNCGSTTWHSFGSMAPEGFRQ